jgi:two-component system, NarL family, nitrate/nitrite response regulator NarL
MRVVLGNDHRLFADALADVLTRHGVVVNARACTPQDVLIAVSDYQPDICLIADRWLDSEGVSSLRLIRRRHPTVNIVILSDRSVTCDVGTAVEIGASAVVSHRQHVTDLLDVLRRVRAGERTIEAAAAEPEIHMFSRPVSAYGDRLLDMLTIREQEVLKLMTDGKATKEIAKALAITLHTARTHVQSVLSKLGVHSRLEASGMVARSGLLSPSGQFAFSPMAQEAAVSG